VYLLPPGWVVARHDLVECVKSLQVDEPAVAPDAAARNLATLRLRVRVVAPEHVAVVSLVANRATSVSTACDYLQAKEVEEVVAQDLTSPQVLAQSYRPRNYLLSW
jgi:succinylarginine dihydrolase